MAAQEPAEVLPPAVEAAVARIRADREHGASWLAREAARLLAEVTAEAMGQADDAQLRLIRAAARALARARPSMAAIATTVATIWRAGSAAAGSEHGSAAALRRMHAEAQRLLRAEATAADAIAQVARLLLRGAIYTLSRSGTVEAVLTRLAHGDAAQLRRAVVAESRPGGEGLATARALAAAGLAVTLVPDAACAVFVREVDAVVLGADSVRADGGVVNKVGSYPLALAAREAGVPVYVLAETLKIAAPSFPLAFEELEWPEMPAEPAPGVRARSVGFELVPAALIRGVLSEEGPLDTATIAARARAVDAALVDLLSAGDSARES